MRRKSRHSRSASPTRDHQEPLHLRVEHLAGLGDGYGKADGKAIYIPYTCPGDEVLARPVKTTRDHVQARMVELVSPSPDRRTPDCQHFGACGGCNLQHVSTELYQSFKRRRVEQAVRQSGFALPQAYDMLHLPAATRRRAEFKIHHEGGLAQLALLAPQSHHTIAIEHCPVLLPALAEMLPTLNHALQHDAAKALPSALACSWHEAGLDLLWHQGETPTPDSALIAFAQACNAARLAVQQDERAPRIVHERAAIQLRLGGVDVPVPPGAFLQPSAEGQTAITDTVLAWLGEGMHCVDLFSGLGTYSFPLLQQTKRVSCFEGDEAMTFAAAHIATQQNLPLTATQRDLFTSPLLATELSAYDCAVINPPRAGAWAQCKELAHAPLKRLVMVSCNPASFARDAAALREGGFTLAAIRGIDQFTWSEHLEIVALFTR